VELPLIHHLKTIAVNGKESFIVEEIFGKTYDCTAQLNNKTWLSRYPQCHYLIYNNGNELKLDFKYRCESYGIKCKPTMVKNPQVNAILEQVDQVLAQMLRTAELNMAESVTPDDINVFLDNAALTICFMDHAVLKASPGMAIFRPNMLFEIPYIADRKKLRL
jgi:hypothetical protein